MIYRLILPEWAKTKHPDLKRVLEGEFSDEELQEFNKLGYNVYFLPNYPSIYDPSKPVDGTQIDTFKFVFVDMDLKEGVYQDKESFIASVTEQLLPTYIVDSGNGVHAYWYVSDLDSKSYLKLQRRLCRMFKTDEAVGKIYQLMRVPGTLNTKKEEALISCSCLFESDQEYTCEQLDKALPPLSHEDEIYCDQHYEKTYETGETKNTVEDKLPVKFGDLLRTSSEVREIWAGGVDDRSKSDYRLGHIMFASGFNRKEALSVLVNAAKALERAPKHRISYAENIVDKIWTYEMTQDKSALPLSSTVKEILTKNPNDSIKGTRFPCHTYLDATHHGFRLGQVIGLVAGSGVGKTAMALNMFMGFVQNNPDYDHFFIPLEQPTNEIADRWKTMCGDKTHLYEKVHVISNYAEDGSYRNLSLDEIKEYILHFQQSTGRKVGCVVIDHIGVLKKKGRNGENQDLMEICHQMKPFAVQTNTMLVMQSQAPREKAGIGDLELNKDAAYGTVYFESYCDYLITIWQPLKRCYSETKCPTVTAFKFCKIRHKKKQLDDIQEDTVYLLYFDSDNEHMREMTQEEEVSFNFWNKQATNRRKLDRKTDILPYKSITWTKEDKSDGRETNSSKNSS